MRKIRIGILGGTRGLDFLRHALYDHPYAEVTAICESYLPLKEKIAEELRVSVPGVRVFSEYSEFLDSDLDAVIIANFANEHAPYAIQALNRGMHVCSECLPTQTMKQAVELCEAVEKSGKLYAYAENYCFLPTVLEMRRILESGSLGELMHMEGNFINDCSMRWHLLTRGAPNHWRNFVPSTFYCTHSIGPMLYASGRRAVTVVGMETQRMPYLREVGARSGSAAMEIMQLDNGGMGKSINGNYRRRYEAHYRFIAENGTVEIDRNDFGKIRMFTPIREKDEYLEEVRQAPLAFEAAGVPEPSKDIPPFHVSDINQINTFVQSILGNAEAKKYMIDVYQALDMSTVGLLAYRSILGGSCPIKVPNLRIPAEREAFRNDNRSTDASISFGEDLLPTCRDGFVPVDEEACRKVAERFRNTPLTSGSH